MLGAALGLALAYPLCSLLVSEAKCRAVQPGMRHDEVEAILGTPLLQWHDFVSSGFMYQRGRVPSVMIVVHGDEGGTVTGVTLTHYVGPVCLEDNWKWLCDSLRPTTPPPPSSPGR
jgi:hypothetical protein